MERLTVLRTAWILGSGRMPQPWCRFSTDKKKQLMSKLHSAFEAFAAKRSVSIPTGFCSDMADDFHFADCMTKLHKKNTTSGIGFVFKYKHEFYQEVSNFCKNYNGLRTSSARAEVENTEFPKKACLVVPGLSIKNYRRIPAAWKNGSQDISTLEGAAYILAYRKKPTGRYLLLVSRAELQRAAAKAIISAQQRHSTKITRKRPAQVRKRKQRSKVVIRNNWKGK